MKALKAEISSLKQEKKSLTSKNNDLEASSGDVNEVRDGLQKELEEATNVMESMKRDMESMKRNLRTKERELTRLKEGSTLNEDESTPDARDRAAIVKENKTLKSSNKNLLNALEKCQQALKDGGKFLKEEVSDAVKKKIKAWVKDVSYHTKKFVTDDADLVEFGKSVYNGIKDDPDLQWTDQESERYLPLPEFLRIYQSSCRTELNSRRQYTQTQCLKSAIGRFYPESFVCFPNGPLLTPNFVPSRVLQEIWPVVDPTGPPGRDFHP